MDRKTYREAFDQIPFSADFQERTANLLRQRARELEKENKIVNFSKTKKLAVTAAAAVALLIVSVSAALVWLTPPCCRRPLRARTPLRSTRPWRPGTLP